MNLDTSVQFRVTGAIKQRSNDVFKRHGLTLTDGLRIYLDRVASLDEIPFSLNVPNKETRDALAESALGIGHTRHADAKAMFAHLEALSD